MAKAKKAPKETSLVLVFALVFFVLTTIAFGVLWYMQFSDQQAKDEAVKKSKADIAAAAAVQKEAENMTKLYRVYLGISEAEEYTTLKADHKPGDKLSVELKRINDGLAKKLQLDDPTKVPAELQVWSVSETGELGDAPTKAIFEVVGDAVTKRDAAVAAAKKERDNYAAEVSKIKDAVDAYDKARAAFDKVAKDQPAEFKAHMDKLKADAVARSKAYIDSQAETRKDIDRLEEEKIKLAREKKELVDKVALLQIDVAAQAKKLIERQDQFQFDEPQGKILRRLPGDVVEITLGSAALVRPGLTFTVLPYNYPEQGRQSRIRVMRLPDERGEYKSVERFVEKATIEVIEVVGPNLSRCRITQEFDKIRDGAAPGDLLYNAVWRKGTADHIALVGIFDVNGDGTDDIQSVVLELTRMGIPIDGYFDLKQQKWVGQITEQTRYIVEGYRPQPTATDPNLAGKSELLKAIDTAVRGARDKGVTAVNFRDFFPRMGYRVKIDVPIDRINQATAPYLNRVGTVENPPMNPN